MAHHTTAHHTADEAATRGLLAAAAEIIPTLIELDLADLLASGADVYCQTHAGPADVLYCSACHRLAAVASPRVITGPADPRIPAVLAVLGHASTRTLIRLFRAAARTAHPSSRVAQPATEQSEHHPIGA